MTVKELVEKCSNEITAYQLCFKDARLDTF